MSILRSFILATRPPARRLALAALVASGCGPAGLAATADPPRPPAGPSDPARVAPPLDRTVAGNLHDSLRFLFSGAQPIQLGVAAGAIDPRRIALVRGVIQHRGGAALAGVTVSVLGHPELGHTETRTDGAFDLVVNGGGPLTIDCSMPGLLPVQRRLDPAWQSTSTLAAIAMMPADDRVTVVDLSAGTFQVARGAAVTDPSGTRTPTLVFPPGIQASMKLPGGNQPLALLHVRATEYTVGTRRETMPGDLPATSAYTHALEFTVDEAADASATGVEFSQPVSYYLENFLAFPVGTSVPAGYYDRASGSWSAADNGRIVQVLGVTDGLADLDVSGDGRPADAATRAALGIQDGERQQLAGLYEPGQSLWRVPLRHFSAWDLNWGFGLPPDAEPPPSPRSQGGREPGACRQSGSIIECENQVLGEALPVGGTPFQLVYKSDRVRGRLADWTVSIPLSAATVSKSLKGIQLVVDVAGRHLEQVFAPEPNQSTTYTWDGLDGFGRQLQGPQPITVKVGYVYRGSYENVPRFGDYGNGYLVTGDRDRLEVVLWSEWTGQIGAWDARAQELGGWDLSVHHVYLPQSRILLRGEGEQTGAGDVGLAGTRLAGGGDPASLGDGGPATRASLAEPARIAFGPDGSLYIAEDARIRRVTPDGIIRTIAGNGTRGLSGDGGPATSAQLGGARGLAVLPDGALYFADRDNDRVRRIDAGGRIETVAGGGRGELGDGGPAIRARLDAPEDVLLAADGSLYVSTSERLRRVGPDGIITTVAGGGEEAPQDGLSGTQAALGALGGLALAADGSVYLACPGVRKVLRLRPDGALFRVAGGGSDEPTGDGGPASLAGLVPSDLALGRDGTLLVVDDQHLSLRRVTPDGTIGRIAGWSSDSGGATLGASLAQAVAIGPDGSVVFLDGATRSVRRLGSGLPGFSDTDLVVPARNATELYVFDKDGRHLETVDTLGGATRYRFQYDAAGRLAGVTDSGGNHTTVERDAGGRPTAIVAPDGQRTGLALDAGGYLAGLTNPAGETVSLGYGIGGLLASLTDARGGIHRFDYDSLGRLVKDSDPAGGSKALSRADQDHGYSVAVSTATGRTTRYEVAYSAQGRTRAVTDSAGQRTEWTIDGDGRTLVRFADGMTETSETSADPRFGADAPFTSAFGVTTPGGLSWQGTLTRTFSPGDPDNPLAPGVLATTLAAPYGGATTVFDPATRSATRTSAEGRQQTVTLDAKGRVARFVRSGLAPLDLGYDARGRVVSVTRASRSYTLAYDGVGNLSQITDPLAQTSRLSHDAAGRPVQLTSPDGSTLGIGYDAGGNPTAVTPPGRPAHQLGYSPVDLVQSYSPPDLGLGSTATRYDFDLDQRPTALALPGGGAIALAYDTAGRLATIGSALGTTTLAYDPRGGRLGRVAAPDGETVTFSYDGALLTGEAWSGAVIGSVLRRYGDGLALVSEQVTGAGGADPAFPPVTFAYDADGLLTGAGELAVRRDEAGLVTEYALGSLSETWSYDYLGAPAGHHVENADGTWLYSAQYTRDALGRIASKRERVGNEPAHTLAYGYDAAGRLAQVTRDGVVTARYAYDENGNRLSGPSGAMTAVYDAQDRLQSDARFTYTYRLDGSLQGKVSRVRPPLQPTRYSYDYDALGNLRAFGPVEYQVDGLGRRIGKTIGGRRVEGFLYRNQLQPVAWLDAGGAVRAQFVYGTRSNVPDYMITAGASYRFVTDPVGSVRLVVDSATGAVAERLDYDELGNVLADTAPGFQPFGFAGGLRDRDSGLTRFGARDYDPIAGRWTAKDPLRFGGGSPNLYAYAGGDPVNRIDPSGLLVVGIGITAGGSIGFPGGDVGVFYVIDHQGHYGLYFSWDMRAGAAISMGFGPSLFVFPGMSDIRDLNGFSAGAGIDSPVGCVQLVKPAPGAPWYAGGIEVGTPAAGGGVYLFGGMGAVLEPPREAVPWQRSCPIQGSSAFCVVH